MLHPRRTKNGLVAQALATASALAVLATGQPSEAALSCSTVARRNQLDPVSDVFGNRFRDTLALNVAGQVLFTARPRHAFEKLYLEKPDGSLSIVAETFGLLPNDSLIAGHIPFREVSLNEAGDAAFLSYTSRGRTILVKRAAIALQVGPRVGALSPIAEVRFDGIQALSSIGPSRVLAFAAELRNGRQGIFAYDAVTDVTSIVFLDGTPTLAGRELCTFEDVERSDGGLLAIVAGTQVECDDETETAVTGLHLVSPSGIETVANAGDASPIAGAAYRSIVGSPELNAAGDLLFRARLAGTSTSQATFVRSAATGEIAAVAAPGDALPTGGTIQGLRDIHLASEGAVLFHADITGDTDERFGLFRSSDGTVVPLLLGSAPPPADEFTPPSRYAAFEPGFATSGDGLAVALVARVRDGARPRSKTGVLRCE
jgi:hypothetical protein